MLLLQFVDHWVCLEDWAVNYSWKSVFRGDDYKDHVKCVTEDEKYGGKDFEAKTSKGDAKQQEWLQVRAILYTDISNSWLLNWLDCCYWSRHCWQKMSGLKDGLFFTVSSRRKNICKSLQKTASWEFIFLMQALFRVQGSPLWCGYFNLKCNLYNRKYQWAVLLASAQYHSMSIYTDNWCLW